MNASTLLLILAVLCGATAMSAAVRLTLFLERRGVKTPPPLLGALVFRNLGLYRDATRRETGRVGGLYYAYVIPINAALVLVILAWLLAR